MVKWMSALALVLLKLITALLVLILVLHERPGLYSHQTSQSQVAIYANKQSIIRQYTNTENSRHKGHKTILDVETIPKSLRSPKTELERERYS